MLVLAVALAAWKGAFPIWVAAANGVIAVLLLLGGVSIKGDRRVRGRNGSVRDRSASVAFLVWVLHLAVLFWLEDEAAAGDAALAN